MGELKDSDRVEWPAADQLSTLSQARIDLLDGQLEQREAELRREMAPLQERLRQLQNQRGLIATERRRRERQIHMQRRRQVRAEVSGGAAPSLLGVVSAAEPPEFGELPFTELEFLLDSGGTVALGYPGTKFPTLQMNDGSTIAAVSDLGEARRLYQMGWEFGVPARGGIRVHTPGTRLERLLDPDRCFVRPREVAGGEP